MLKYSGLTLSTIAYPDKFYDEPQIGNQSRSGRSARSNIKSNND